ncbi:MULTISPECIES: DUF6207 family protein [unclassified Streptomyces]|uniref:DUF6207 family protein n=1 Tax=unclassified Streptomyces TaxID=2593676 RepID=UPI0038212A7D
MPGMRPIHDTHVEQPGPGRRGGRGRRRCDRTTREPGEPGVRLRLFLDLRQEPGS